MYLCRTDSEYESDASEDGTLVTREHNGTQSRSCSMMNIVFPTITQTLKSYRSAHSSNNTDISNVRDALVNLQTAFLAVEQTLPDVSTSPAC